ncbi:MAG: Gldg family protein [Clostridia bacterium]|nr:Gldg family protein [Clostridia bacterium]
MNKFLQKAEDVVSSRGFSSGVVTAAVIALVIVANVIIYTLTSLFGLYLYSPTRHDYGITGVTDELFSEAEEKGDKLTITFLMAEDDLKDHVTGMYVLETAKAYAERYSFIDLKFVNLLTKMDEDNRIVDLTKYQTDLRGNETPLRTHSVIFSYGKGNEENYRVITDTYSTAGFADFYSLDSAGTAYAYSGEEVIAAMMAWVLNEEHKVVYFTENHGETIDVAFSNLLSSAGYYVDVINLRKQDVPEDAAFVAISNPISDFESAADGFDYYGEIQRLEKYLKEGNGGRGGSLYVAIDPYSDKLDNLEDLIGEYGITIAGSGESEFGYSRELVLDPSEAIALDSMSFIASYAGSDMAKSISDNVVEYKNGRVLLSEVARLVLDGDKGAESLLVSSSTSRVLWEGNTVDSDGGYDVCAYSSRTEGEGAESKIMVVPSVLLTNGDLMVADGYSNKEFMYSALSEIFGSSTAIYGTKSVQYDSGIVENLTQSTAAVFTVLLLAIPVALTAVGVIVVVRRKRR